MTTHLACWEDVSYSGICTWEGPSKLNLGSAHNQWVVRTGHRELDMNLQIGSKMWLYCIVAVSPWAKCFPVSELQLNSKTFSESQFVNTNTFTATELSHGGNDNWVVREHVEGSLYWANHLVNSKVHLWLISKLLINDDRSFLLRRSPFTI